MKNRNDYSFFVVLMRHGQSTWNKEGRFTGWVDVPLTDKGKQEAIRAANILIKNNIQPDRVFTSVLLRAKQTVDILLTIMRRSVILEQDWFLNERHYGALQGKKKITEAKKHGVRKVKMWRRSFDYPPPMLSPDEAKQTIPPCAGESLKDVYKRVVPFWNKHIYPKIEKETILVCAHGNSLRALMKYLFLISDKDIENLEIDTGMPIICYFNNKGEAIDYEYLH